MKANSFFTGRWPLTTGHGLFVLATICVGASLALAAGCGTRSSAPPADVAPTQAFRILSRLSNQIDTVPDTAKRDELMATVERLKGQLTFGELKMPPAAHLLMAKDIQILPTTQVADWNHDGTIDGFEVLVEALDSFGDSTKIVGKLYFELFAYRNASADRRGLQRVSYWEVNLDTAEQCIRYWDRFSRNYHFNLVWPSVPKVGEKYILQATYVAPWGENIETQRTLVRKE